MRREMEDREGTISAGKYVHPERAAPLPPGDIAAGKYVRPYSPPPPPPGDIAGQISWPPDNYVSKDWSKSYHFGSRARGSRRGDE